MKKNRPNELERGDIDVTVDGNNAILFDWSNMETVNIHKEDWQKIKEHIDKWFETSSTHMSNTHVSDIKFATVSNIDVNNIKVSGGL